MTLEEFQRRLIAQKNAQSQSLLNPNLKLDNYTNDTKKNNYDNNLENKVISNNPNTKEVLKAPISQSVNRKLNIDPSALKNNNTIFDDIGNNIKNYKIGVKQGGLNFVNTFGKWGNAISNYVFNREEKTEKSIDEDLKMYGIDGTGLTLQEKVNKLIETDPLSMDKYSRVLQSNGIEYRGNDILSNIGNAVSMLQANNGNIFTAPYDEIINGISLTEDEEGNVITDTPFSKRDVNVIDNKIKELEEEANKNTEQVDNSLLKYTAGLMPSLGSNTVSLVADTLAPGTGSVYFTASAANSYALDGKEKGLSDDAALLYGATLGYLDGQLEKIGLNNLTKAGKNMVKGATKEAIKSYATSMLDNYIQEALMEPAQETVNQIFTGESDWKGMPSRMNQAGIAGAVSSAILGGASAGISKGVNIATNINQQNKLKTQITEKINNNTMLEKDVKTQMLNSLDKLNVNSLTNLNHELDTIDEVITQINKSDITNIIESRKNSLNMLAKNDISKNNSRQVFLDSAKLNNIDVDNNTEVLDSMFEMAYQRGVNISIDGKAFNSNNQNALWRVNSKTGQREVIINPNNPEKALQNITIHEMTHDMENTPSYQKLSKVVLDYAKQQNNYDNAFKELSNMYSEEYKNYKGNEFNSRIEQEMVADILGEKLGNQEFVNHIVNTNNSVARNIYNWVVDKLNRINKLTGYKFEKLYWADVKNKFDKAFNSEFNNYEGNIKYQMMNSKEYGQYWHVDSSKDIFKNIKNKKDLKDVVYDYILNGNKNYGVITDKLNNKNVEFIRISANEYVYGRNSKNLNSGDYTKKMRMSPSIDDLINNASITYSSPLTHNNKLFVNGFNNYQGKVEIADTIFSYIVRVGKTKSNDSIFYDISLEPLGKIKGTEVEVPSTNKSTSLLKNSVPSKYSITPKDSNVNYVNTDDKGRQLSQQQQEYFKDSKVRDKNGNLLTVYHGTNQEFNIFDINKGGKSNSDAGIGFWFTESQEGAYDFADTNNSLYGGNDKVNVKETYLNIKKPKVYETIDNSLELDKIENKLKTIKEEIYSLENKNYYLEENESEIRWASDEEELRLIAQQNITSEERQENFVNDAIKYQELIKEQMSLEEEYDNKKYNDSYELFRADIYKIAGKSSNEANFGGTGMYLENNKEILNKFRENLIKEGYDGIIIKDTKYDRQTLGKGKNNTQYIVFNSNQIKNVDNTNPTINDDIRYSKSSSGAYQQFLKDSFSNDGTKTYMKDIKKVPVSEEVNNKTSEETQLKNDIDNFSKQVDSVINGTFPKNDMLTLLSNTPKILQDIGLKNYPITMTQKHLDTIMNAEGKHKNANYHNLGEEIVKQLPEAIANPLDIVQSNTNKNSIVLTTYLADKNNNTIIASIKIDGKGTVNDVRIDTNVMTSAYGKDNYDRFMQKNIKQGNLLYDIDQGTIKKLSGLGSNYLDDSTYINNIIPSEQNYVNNNENSIKNKENVPDSPEFKEKQRKRYQTIINSEVVSKEAKAIAKELMGVDTYIPESNVQQLNRADYTIEKLGVERALEGLKNKIDGGQRVLAEDIAIGDRLIQYYSKTGQKKELQDAIQYTAMAGTEGGRTVQAMSMIAHQSPEGQVLWIQRSINKLNQKIASKKGGKVEVIDGRQVVNKNGKILEKVQLFEFTSDMQESILSAKSNEEMYDILDNIYEELGQQVTKNTFEKLDSWRYFSMLANPTTHVRNIVGNTAMTGTQGIKNKIAGGIEDIVAIFNKDIERTKSLVRIADAETVKFAKDDIKNVADRLGLNQNKYSPRSRIESNKREFKSNLLNETLGKAYKSNSRLLEVEDGWGLKYNYARALSGYIASNNIDINNITDAQLGKARNYAIAQAKEATFHQESRLASALNQVGNNNEIAKFVLDSTVPFKAVPINVAKTGLAYSPLQLVKSTTVDLVNLRNGNINLNQYIDNLSKGLTGTGIALIGYMLAQMGILKANGSDEDKEKYDEAQGKQTFSVTIGTQNFSLSWLAPTAIPLFIGAEISEILDSDKENKNNLNDKDYDKALNIAKDSIDVFANAMNPMTEMSMLSGLTSVFRSYDQDNYLVGIGTNIVKSYANQYVPTALGKIARITDEYERDTTSTKSDTVSKAIDSTKNQIMSKIPVLRQMLPVKKDTWGREIKSPTLPIRIFENTLAPYTRKEISNDKVDKYLNNLYDKTKDKDLLPDTISKTLIFDGSTYRYTNEEYNKYKAEFGKSAYDKITKVMNNKAFNKLANEEKVDIIDKIYSDCKEEVKEEYAKVHKIEYERSDKDIEIEEEIKKGLDVSNSYIYKTIISKKESDKDEDGNTISNSATKNKLKYIMSMEIDDKQKQHLINISINDTDYDVSVNDLNKLKGDYLTYLQQSGKTPENGGMTAREKYIKLVDANIPVEQLNKYYNEIGDVEGTKDENGKTISGSKKQAVFNYINSLSLNIPQKQILLAKEYDSFAKEYYWDIINYINSLNITKEEKSSIFSSIYN